MKSVRHSAKVFEETVALNFLAMSQRRYYNSTNSGLNEVDMPSIPIGALSAVSAVVAALIAAVISLLGLVISKEHRVSEFRQAWSDALREDVALLITHVECLRGAAHAAGPNKPSWAEKNDHFVAINRAITAIRLRVGVKTPEGVACLAALTELTDAAQAGDIATSVLIEPAVEKLTEKSRQVIESEWSLIRKGEGVYLWSRRGTIAIIAIAMVSLAILIPSWLRKNHRKTNNTVNAKTNKTSSDTAPVTKIYVFICGPFSSNEHGEASEPCSRAEGIISQN